MVSFSLKFGLCLGLLLLFYLLFLEKEKMHRFNRFYLLASIVFSFIAPLIIIYVQPEFSASTNKAPLSLEHEPAHSPMLTVSNALVVLYIFGIVIFGERFIKNVITLTLKATRNERVKHNKATLVLIEEETLP